jgi:hypothetical protein
VLAELHFAEDAFALHPLLQHLEGLVDVVVSDENLHAAFLHEIKSVNGPDGQSARATGSHNLEVGHEPVREDQLLNISLSAALPARLASVMESKKTSEWSMALARPAR